MHISLLKPFWRIISNRHVKENMDKLLVIRIQLMNQYTFSIFFIFIADAFRNLWFGRPVNFIVLFSVACLLLLLSRYTRAYFNAKGAASVLAGATLILFYFCSTAGFHNGIAPYYFAILFAALFIFNEKNKLYNIFVFLWIFGLFYTVQLFELDRLSGIWRSNVCFNQSQHTTLVQSVLLLVVNGYFIMLKNYEMQKLYRQALQAVTPSHANTVATDIPESLSVRDVVKLAQGDDAAFIVAFKQVFPAFYSNLYRYNPDMTNEEFKFCALLKLGFTTKDIANYNHLAVRTVQTKKSRLRKSFCVPPQEDLYNWIAQF